MPGLGTRSDPSALRFLIGHDLRVERERAGVNQAEAAKALGSVQSRIHNLETGKIQQRPKEVTALLRRYGVDVAHVDRVASLAGRADQEIWWAPFGEVLPDWFKTFVGLEGLASSVFTYESMVLPGQLQTAAYATALLAGNLRVAPMDVPQVVRARMARHRLADDISPLTFVAVVEEYVLDRIVGGSMVMRAQLEHLLKLMKQENVELHVMPVDVVVHDGLDGDFILLDFGQQAQPIGYVEYPAGALYVQDPQQVELYKMASDRLRDAALSTLESAEFIRSRISKLAS